MVELRRRAGPGLGALVQNDGLASGTTAPVVAGLNARDGKVTALAMATDRGTLLAFLAPSCPPCVNLVADLNRVAARERAMRFVAVVQDEKGFDFAKGLSERITVLRDDGGAVSRAFQVIRTPLVYLIDGEGKIVRRTVPNSVLDLDDTLSGFGHEQGDMPWIPDAASGNP